MTALRNRQQNEHMRHSKIIEDPDDIFGATEVSLFSGKPERYGSACRTGLIKLVYNESMCRQANFPVTASGLPDVETPRETLRTKVFDVWVTLA